MGLVEMVSKKELERQETFLKEAIQRENLTPEQKSSFQSDLRDVQYSLGKTTEAEKTELARKEESGKPLTAREESYLETTSQLEKEIEKAKESGYDVSASQQEALQEHLRHYPESKLTVAEKERGISFKLSPLVPTIFVVQTPEGVRKATSEEVQAFIQKRIEERNAQIIEQDKARAEALKQQQEGEKLNEYIQQKLREGEFIKEKQTIQTSTISPEQEKIIERTQREFELLSYVPLRETQIFYPPEKILISETRETTPEGERIIQQMNLPYTELGNINPSFRFRTELDKNMEELERLQKEKPLSEQVAQELIYQVSSALPTVTIPKMFAPDEFVTTQERIMASIQTGLFFTAPFIRSIAIGKTTLSLLGVSFGGIGLYRNLPSALEGKPEAIATSIISSAMLLGGAYNIYKDLTSIVEAKAYLTPKTREVLLKSGEVGFEAGEIELIGRVYGRSKLDVILDRNFKLLEKMTITGTGKLVAMAGQGDIRALAGVDYSIGDKISGRILQETEVSLTQEQLQALMEGKPITFESYNKAISDFLQKGETTVTLKESDSTYLNKLKIIEQISNEEFKGEVSVGASRRIGQIDNIMENLDAKNSIMMKDITLNIQSGDKIFVEGFAGQNSISDELHGAYSTESIRRFKPMELGGEPDISSMTRIITKTATKPLIKTATKPLIENIGDVIAENIPKIETKIITPVILPTKTVETKPVETRAVTANINQQLEILTKQEEKRFQDLQDSYSGIMEERALLKQEEKKMLEHIQKPLQDQSQKFEELSEHIQKQLQDVGQIEEVERIQEHIQKQIQVQEQAQEQIYEYETLLAHIPPHIPIEIPIEIFIPKIEIPSWDRNIALFTREGKGRGKSEPMEFGYTPSIFAIEYDIRKKVKDINKEFTSGLEIRPIPDIIKKVRHRKKKKKDELDVGIWTLPSTPKKKISRRRGKEKYLGIYTGF